MEEEEEEVVGLTVVVVVVVEEINRNKVGVPEAAVIPFT